MLNLNSKIMSKPIFPHFYSSEAPVLWRLIGENWLFLGNIFAMLFNEMNGYYTAGRGSCYYKNKPLMVNVKFACQLCQS
jgi:hypothetical protein